VTTQTTHQRRVLHGQRLVPLAAAPIVDGTDRPSQPCTPRLARQPPTTGPGAPPVQREPQEVVGGRTRIPGRLFPRSVEGPRARLAGMKPQPITLQPLPQHRQDPLRVLAPFEADDEVIRITDQASTPVQARLDLPLEPTVEDVVQVDVAEERRQ